MLCLFVYCVNTISFCLSKRKKLPYKETADSTSQNDEIKPDFSTPALLIHSTRRALRRGGSLWMTEDSCTSKTLW